MHRRTSEPRVIEAAHEYVRRGWAVVPVKPRSKKPCPKDWTKLRVDDGEISRYFRVGGNIGLLLGESSGGLVDIDLDCPEALKLADSFLPATSLVHGRKSKRASHRWYRVSPAPERTRKFSDLNGATLVELRSTGGQTVVPPSVHESGEPIVWESNGDPADVAPGVLELAVSKLAAATLLSRHWPAPGLRHDATLALSGLLLGSGWSVDDVLQFIEIIAVAVQDEEARERKRDVHSTAARFSSGLKATGAKTLANIIGNDVVARARGWLRLKNEASSAPIVSTFCGDANIAKAIRGVALDKGTPAFDKRRKIALFVRDALSERGYFLRTRDNRALFFHSEERRLYDVDHSPFEHLLTQISGLSSTESYFGFVLGLLQASANREARLVDVHTLAYFDRGREFLAVSNGATGMWIRERSGNWLFRNNGDEGLLFLTDPQAEEWVPDLSGDGHALEWFLSQFMFASFPLTAEDFRTLMLVCLVQQFFPTLRKTRMIPTFLGPQGSGKTTAMRLVGRLLVGPEFDVTGLQRDREDAFVAAVCNRVVLGLDNADSRIPFLPDALARYATGQRYQLRRLYTTNEEASFSPRAILMISSRDPHFNRPDVAERLLPFNFDRPKDYRPEFEIFADLYQRRGAVMGSLLNRVGQIADSLPDHPTKALRFRMADFASFGEQVSASHGRSSDWIELLGRLESAQVEFASEGDGLVDSLRVLLAREQVDAMPISQLYRRCKDVAESHCFAFPRSCQSFGRRLTSTRRVIEIELGVHFQESRVHGGQRLVSFVSSGGCEGGVGDECGQKVRKESTREPA